MIQPLDVSFGYVPDIRGQALIQRFQRVTLQDKVLVPTTLGRTGFRVLLQLFHLIPHTLRSFGRDGKFVAADLVWTATAAVVVVEAITDLGRS